MDSQPEYKILEQIPMRRGTKSSTPIVLWTEQNPLLCEFHMWWTRKYGLERYVSRLRGDAPPRYVTFSASTPRVFDRFRHQFWMKQILAQMDGIWLRYADYRSRTLEMPIKEAVFLSNSRFVIEFN